MLELVNSPLRMTGDEAMLPPFNIEAEISVLAGILTDPTALDRVSDKITPDSFYHSAHRLIYQAILRLTSKGKPVTLVTLSDHLVAQGQLERVGGRVAISNLILDPIAGINCDLHADLVAEKAARRELIDAAKKIILAAHDQSVPLTEVIDQSEARIYEISNKAGKGSDVEHISEACARVFKANEDGVVPGLRLQSFLDLDDMTGGWRKGQLVTVAAATAMGKSHFMVAQALETAEAGFPVILFSCEMTADELAERALARSGRLDSAIISRRQVFHSSDMEKFVYGCEKVSGLPIYVLDDSNPTMSEIKAAIRRVAAIEGQPPRMVLLDYLQLLGEGSSNRVREIDNLARGCKCIAKDFDLTFMALAQINRGVNSRQDKRPTLSDLRESGAIEQHSNTVLFLYRDDYYNPETVDPNVIELIVSKNRGGRTGTVKMFFSPEISGFRSIAS